MSGEEMESQKKPTNVDTVSKNSHTSITTAKVNSTDTIFCEVFKPWRLRYPGNLEPTSSTARMSSKMLLIEDIGLDYRYASGLKF